MSLLRTSSTPIISSMLEAGGGSGSRNPPSTSLKTGLERKLSIPTDAPSIPLHKTGLERKLSIPTDAPLIPLQGIRRVSSDSYIDNTLKVEEQTYPKSPTKFRSEMSLRPKKGKPLKKLEPIPSFSAYSGGFEESSDNGTKHIDGDNMNIGFSLPLINDKGIRCHEFQEPKGVGINSGLYMATGLGINMGFGYFRRSTLDGGNNDIDQMERYYEKIVMDNPCNALILRNYAQFLHKVKRDYQRAEEVYSRAILADPYDGEIISEYAKLRWEIHGEEDAASKYFACAVKASPDNSNVLAAYASFLWETNERDDDQHTITQQQFCPAT